MPSSVRPTGTYYSCSITEKAMMPDSKSIIVHELRVFENRMLKRTSELKEIN
jgi:hypothetical protein